MREQSNYHMLSTIKDLLESQEKYLGREIDWELLKKYRMLCNRMFVITRNDSQDPFTEYIFVFNARPEYDTIEEIATKLLGYCEEDDWSYSLLDRTLVIYGLEY